MKITNQHKKSIVEVASIGGIMAFCYWMDRSFGLLDWITTELSTAFPGFQQYSLNMAAVGFVGLATYSLMLRVKGRKERVAREMLEKFLQQKDFTDAETGLSNRLGFKLMLGELRNSQVMTRKTIMAFEIRNLDSIASVHGEKTASEIEKLYSENITALSREHDFAARAETGRFYLLINSTNREESSEQAESVLNTIKHISEKGMLIDGMTMSTHLNIAMLDLTAHQKKAAEWSEQDIVQRLDYMLYKSRKNAHGEVEVYSDKMEKSLRLRALVESELLDSLKDGSIQPYFQPFIDMKSNNVAGFEILARWDHPTEGFIPPDIFVHVADDIGAMRELTLTMLERACVAAKNWPEHIRLAFNVSPNELRNDATMDNFFEVLKRTGISTDRVEIEITENAFIEEVGEITDMVARLKKRGIQISIDDFGTGFSNFSHLKMLPFDKIKIDQSFIRDMASNSDSQAIVKNIIALGKSMGLPTVAEGVEIGENRDVLHDLGCSVGQGYLYAKPLLAKDVLPFLDSYQAEIIYLDEVA